GRGGGRGGGRARHTARGRPRRARGPPASSSARDRPGPPPPATRTRSSLSWGTLRRVLQTPTRVFRDAEVNSPPLIERVRFAAPGGANPVPLALVAVELSGVQRVQRRAQPRPPLPHRA